MLAVRDFSTLASRRNVPTFQAPADRSRFDVGWAWSEDVSARIRWYIANHNRRFPTKCAKFGGHALVSLDAQLFNEGTMTLSDTISRGLWD
jgi:hypothetical protein